MAYHLDLCTHEAGEDKCLVALSTCTLEECRKFRLVALSFIHEGAKIVLVALFLHSAQEKNKNEVAFSGLHNNVQVGGIYNFFWW